MAELRLHLSPWAVPYFVAGVLAYLMLWLVAARGRGALRRPFLGVLASIGLTLLAFGALVSSADLRSALWLARAAQSVALWSVPFLIWFTEAATERPLRRWRRASIVAAVVGTACTLSPWVISGARVYPFGFTGRAGPLYPVVSAAMLLAAISPWTLWRAFFAETRPLKRRQLLVVGVSSLIGGLAYTEGLPLVGLDVPPVGWVPMTASAVTLLFAIVRYRLLDLRVALRRSLLWIALTAFGAAPFLAVTFAVGPSLRGHPLELGLLFAALVIVMRVYLVSLQPRLERLIGRRRLDLDAEMAVINNLAGTIQTTEEFGRAIDRFLAAVDRRLAALVVIDSAGRARVALSAWGGVPAPSRGSPLLVELAGARSLISRDRAHGPARVEIERACVRWGAEFLGPLVEGDTLLGLIAISPKMGGGLADTVELDALDRMCVAVTSALAGARLYERLRGLSRELQQKAEARMVSLARAVDQLRGAEARLVESEKMASLGQIVAGVAADLRDEVDRAAAEVARLRDHAEILVVAAEETRAADPALSEPLLDEASRDVAPRLDAISEGARRAHAIAADLARFAPSEPAAPEAGPRRVASLSALVDSTLTLAQTDLAGVTVERHYDESLPPLALEPGPLGQVILNLVINAVQAMEGAGTLTVSTRQGDGFVEVAVADTGPGIAPEVLPRIFEPFFTTKGAATGTGLGLSISYGIVARQGGRIAVDSELGRGSTFRVQLPTGSSGWGEESPPEGAE